MSNLDVIADTDRHNPLAPGGATGLPAPERTSDPLAESLQPWRVLFVDDEPNVLAGLRRMMRPVMESWDLLFAGSGPEALEILDQVHVDAVVSDMKMPGMNGAELLAQVQSRHPATARLVLSGQVDPDTVLDLVRSAQQFLAKPCDPKMLTEAISRALSVQVSLTNPELRELIGGVTALPTLPAVYGELVSAIGREDADLSHIATIIASDVATSAELLKLVNSSFFGLPREVYSIGEAVRLLGLDNIQALVLTSSLLRVNDALAWILDVELLREQSLRRAAIARAIAQNDGWSPPARNIAVLSAMLRDVGKLVLVEGRPDAAAQLAADVLAENQPPSPARLAELELNAYGCTVPQASAYLLGLWGFSAAVVHTIAAYPLTDLEHGFTKFDQLLAFASTRVATPGHADLDITESMDAERSLAWNLAADDILEETRADETP
jgi:HD-like signal output (HDOD) protein/CheY-like chemotaxis protein